MTTKPKKNETTDDLLDVILAEKEKLEKERDALLEKAKAIAGQK